MSLSLTAFQDEFIGALYGNKTSSLSGLYQQPGFEVYRNTVIKAAIDALQANFPTVTQLVGEEWFRAAATIYARQLPPTDPQLIFYGAEFPDFLDNFEHTTTMPYLGNVARLDRLWICVHSAGDEPAAGITAFANLTGETLANMFLKPNAAARWIWFTDHPAYTLWQRNRERLEIPQNLPWQGEGALLTRKAGQVMWQQLGVGGCTFLDGCAANLSLGHAAELALDQEPELDMNELLSRLIKANALTIAERDQ